MARILRNDWPLLLFGDLACLLAALPMALTLRYGEVPSLEFIAKHLIPFAGLALIFTLVFFACGLYDAHTLVTRGEVPFTILIAQVANTAIAALFFFAVPVFGLAPKTNLIVYLIVSVLVVALWRTILAPRLLERSERMCAVIIGDGLEILALVREATENPAHPFTCKAHVPVRGRAAAEVLADMRDACDGSDPTLLIADLADDALAETVRAMHELVVARPRTFFVDFHRVYEHSFRKVALGALRMEWLLTNAARPSALFYDGMKRLIDIVGALAILVLLAVLTPFVALLMRLEGPGPLLVSQERMGRGGRTIVVKKFRTMTKMEHGAWVGETENRVTKVGAFLRQTSIDELPQALSILGGSLSLIGPRSDIAALADRLAEAIPFYMLRYTVTPGVSGWAQVNQRYAPGNISPQSVEESRERLAYDLYYVKHRSLALDISITLRTMKTLLSRLAPKRHG